MSRSKKTTSAGPLIPNVGPVVPKPVTPVRIWPRWKDAALVEAIAGKVSRGWSLETAGLACGLSRTAVVKWLSRYDAASDESDMPEDEADFCASFSPIARALSDWFGESEEMAAEGHGGRQWMLARRFQMVYGQKQEIAVSTSARPIADDETRRLLAGIAASADSEPDPEG